MELSREIPTSTSTLKVNLKCCKECEGKTMKKLKEIHEVDSVTYNTKRGLLRVSGNIDPMILIQKFAKWGRKAELYYFQKDSMQIDQDECKNSSCKNEVQDAKADELASSDRSKKGFMKVFVSWFSKKDKKAKTGTSRKNGFLVKSPAAAKWHFPNTSMGPLGTFGPPGNYNHNTSMMFPRPGTVPSRYAYRSIPPPHPYGAYQSMPRAHPMANPMIMDGGYRSMPRAHPMANPMIMDGGYRSMPRAPPMMNPMIMNGGYQWTSGAPPMVNPMIHYTSYEDNNFHYP